MAGLSLVDEAYNAAIVALNDAEDRLVAAYEERLRAWDAAEALNPIGTHGARSSTRNQYGVPFDAAR